MTTCLHGHISDFRFVNIRKKVNWCHIGTVTKIFYMAKTDLHNPLYVSRRGKGELSRKNKNEFDIVCY